MLNPFLLFPTQQCNQYNFLFNDLIVLTGEKLHPTILINRKCIICIKPTIIMDPSLLKSVVHSSGGGAMVEGGALARIY